MMPQKSKGRQKIKMEKMENESNLNVTFSKRRHGLFKKASELCVLCGVEIAILVFSPSKKPYSFGHPSLEMIVDRFLTQNSSQPNPSNSQLVEVFRNANINQLNMQLTYLISQLEVEKKKGEELTYIRKEGISKHWWEAPIESLGLEELERLKVAMDSLKIETEGHKERIVAANRLAVVPVSGANQVMGSGPSMTPYGHHFSR